MRVVRTTLVLLALLLVTAALEAATPLTPLVADWSRFFSVEIEPARPAGVVWNTSDWGTRRIQLLVEGLDAGGQIVSQQVVWLGADLPAGAHAPFEAPVAPSPSYRVSVFAFSVETTAGPR